MLAKKCNVLIYQSNLSTIPKNIFEHEIPILEGVFGEGSVTKYDYKPMVQAVDQATGKGLNYQVQSDKPVKYEVEEIDHDEEYVRLFDLYGKHETINVHMVTHIYGRIEDRKMEVKAKENYKDEPLPAPVEESAGESGDMNYSNMTKMELKNTLDNFGVPYPPNATKPALIDYCERYDRGEIELEKVS